MPPKRRYDEIAAFFRRQIQDGELEPRAKLPSLRAVCDEFNVSMNTANRAFQMLKAEGLTTATLEGTVVAHQPKVTVTGAARLKRIERTGKSHAPNETTTDRWVGVRSCGDALIADLLDIEPHDEIILRRRVFRRDGQATSVGLSCIHTRALVDVPELIDERPFDRWWQEIYEERTGRDVTRSPERRTARLISTDELESLGIALPAESAAAVLVVVNVFHDEAGPLEVWEDVYPPGTWQVDEE
ncbi:MAG TPA: GntR family transcriptional regulator [Streptomyces sp.]